MFSFGAIKTWRLCSRGHNAKNFQHRESENHGIVGGIVSSTFPYLIAKVTKFSDYWAKNEILCKIEQDGTRLEFLF